LAVSSVISRHTEESSFLWLLRSYAVHQPHYSLKDLAKLDLRVEAHLDGLRIAGDAGWEACRAELAWEAEGEFFAAGSVAFESGNADRIGVVTDALLAAPQAVRGLASSLGWLGLPRAQPYIDRLLASNEPVLRLAGLSAAAILRRHPGPALKDAITSDDPALRARGLQAVGELGFGALAGAVSDQLADADPSCRFAAAWSGALLNVGAAVPALRAIAQAPGPNAEAAAAMAVRRMPLPEANAWRTTLARQPDNVRAAIAAAGALGDPAAIDWLLSLMNDEKFSRPAGEAFTMIAGADLAYLDLEMDAPEGGDAGPTEDAADENVSLDPDDHLPWPHQGLVTQWWRANHSRFAPGLRFLTGQPTDIAGLTAVLREGRQRQRAAAAMERMMQRPEGGLFEVRARGDWQRSLLGR